MSTSGATHRTYSFGEFTLDLDRGALLKAGADIKLRPKTFEVLCYLVERQGLLVSKDDLLDAIWGHTVVTESAVTHCVTDVRRALQDQSQKMLRTIPRRGYIFDVPVTQHVGSTALSDTSHSIAVLPFVNLSDSTDDEYFSDGLTDTLIHVLAQVRGLKVTARTSSFYFKGKNIDVGEIANELNVGTVLEGSVQKSGNRVRVIAQLVSAADGTHLWSKSFDRDLNDIFAVQDEIAEDVVSEKQIALLGDVPNVRRTDTEAYSLFLQAQHIARQGSPEAYRDAILLLRRVLSIDESYAPAWSALANVFNNEVANGLRQVAEGIEEARDAGTKALALDPNLASAHVEMARIAMTIDHDYPTAISHLRAVRTRDSRFFHRAASLAQQIGRYDLAVEWGQQAILLDPVSPYAHMGLGTSYLADSQYSEAEQVLQKAIMLSPFAINARMNMAILRLEQGKPEAALQIVEGIDIEEAQIYIRSMAMFALGDARGSDELVNLYIQKFGDQSASGTAAIYAFRREADLAFHWLERAYEGRDNALSSILVNPLYRNLDDHPKMQPLLRKIGLSDEHLAAIELDLALSD